MLMATVFFAIRIPHRENYRLIKFMFIYFLKAIVDFGHLHGCGLYHNWLTKGLLIVSLRVRVSWSFFRK